MGSLLPSALVNFAMTGFLSLLIFIVSIVVTFFFFQSQSVAIEAAANVAVAELTFLADSLNTNLNSALTTLAQDANTAINTASIKLSSTVQGVESLVETILGQATTVIIDGFGFIQQYYQQIVQLLFDYYTIVFTGLNQGAKLLITIIQQLINFVNVLQIPVATIINILKELIALVP